MALTTPYPKVQGSKFLLGPSMQGETILIVPAVAADYAAGGYVITALECGLSLIQQAIVTGGNATAYPASAGWYPEIVFPETQLLTSSEGFTGYSQFLFKVYVAATGVELAPAPAVSLNGAVWQVTVIGI
jgi:hypothetical protein